MVDLWCTVRVWLEVPDERSRQRVRGPAPGRKFSSPRGFVARRNSNGLFSQIGKFFPIAPVDFQSIGGGEGGGFGTFFGIFFFFREFWGRGGGRVTPKPEARVARFLVGMFRNRFFKAGVDAKVSPKVSLDQAIDENVSPNHIILNLKKFFESL